MDIEKKIKEFRRGFCYPVSKKDINKDGNIIAKGTTYQLRGGLSYTFEFWLKQALIEAKKDAYCDCLTFDLEYKDIQCNKKVKECYAKLKALEGK